MNKVKLKNRKFKGYWWQKFPQISRLIPVRSSIKIFLYRLFLLMLFLGTIFLLVLNIYSVIIQPFYLKALLKNPADTQALKMVMRQNSQPELDLFLKQHLQAIAGIAEVEEIRVQKQQQIKKIKDLEQLLKEYPNYPDGYAYLAVLYFRQSFCDKAQESLNKAIALDENRIIFQELKTKIGSCPN